MIDNILIFVFFLLGIVIGSFLNVVIFRLNTHKTFGGKSICLSCEKCIYWYDLVPVFSFLILKGRCRHCKSKISFQYPLVEIASGIIFALLFYKFSYIFYFDPILFSIIYSYYIALFSLLLIISVYDIRHKIIPDILSLFVGVIAFIGIFLFSGSAMLSFPKAIFYPHIPSLFDFSGALLAIPFILLWLFSKGKYMGLGDGKLVIGLGFLLGPFLTIDAILLSFWIGAFVSMILWLLQRVKGLKSEIPFAPFLALGAFLSLIFEFNLLSIF